MSRLRIVVIILSILLWACLIIRSGIFGAVGVALVIGGTSLGVNFGAFIADIIREDIYKK